MNRMPRRNICPSKPAPHRDTRPRLRDGLPWHCECDGIHVSVRVAEDGEPSTSGRRVSVASLNDAIPTTHSVGVEARRAFCRSGTDCAESDSLSMSSQHAAVLQNAEPRAFLGLGLSADNGRRCHDDLMSTRNRCGTGDDKSKTNTSHRNPFTLKPQSTRCPSVGTTASHRNLENVSSQSSTHEKWRPALSCRERQRRSTRWKRTAANHACDVTRE